MNAPYGQMPSYNGNVYGKGFFQRLASAFRVPAADRRPGVTPGTTITEEWLSEAGPTSWEFGPGVYPGHRYQGYGGFWDLFRVGGRQPAGPSAVRVTRIDSGPTGVQMPAGFTPDPIDIGTAGGRRPMSVDQVSGLISAIGAGAAGVGSLIHGGKAYAPPPGMNGQAGALAWQQASDDAARQAQTRNMMFLAVGGLVGLGMLGVAFSQRR